MIPIARVLLSTGVGNVAWAVRATTIVKGGGSLEHPVREAQGRRGAERGGMNVFLYLSKGPSSGICSGEKLSGSSDKAS